MDKIQEIYKKLYTEFGPQGWWPITPENEFHPKHNGIIPKTAKQRFEIIIGAILTQNTSWKNVEKAIFNLNKAKLVDIDKIKKINLKKLASLIKPSGYYNQKADRLKIIAEFFSKNNSPKREQLLQVKGIGPETADSILLYAFQNPYFVIDAYTKRIFSRIGICKKDVKYEDLQSVFHKNLSKDTKIFNEYHALIVELAKQFCTKQPKCDNCPINSSCKKFI
jgi:endonuclease-3 related protein